MLTYMYMVVIFLQVNFNISAGALWQKYEGREFLYVKEKLTWFEAQTMCSILGGNLAHADTSSVNDFLISMTDKKTYTWLGGADILVEGNWKWFNPEKPMTFTYWSSNGPQPNGGRSSNCLSFWYSKAGYKWADDPCNFKMYFLCERAAKQSSIPSKINRYQNFAQNFVTNIFQK